MGPGVGEERRIIKYLLGQLPDEERAQVEERFFKDEEYEELLRSVENELVDEYVRGRLPDADRESFETFFLVSARHRQKVRFASAFRSLEGTPTPETVTPADTGPVVGIAAGVARSPFLKGWQSLFLMPSFRYSVAALLLVLSAIGLWFLAGPVRQQNQNEPLQARDNQPPPTSTPSPTEQGQPPPQQSVPGADPRAPDGPERRPEADNLNRLIKPPVPGGRPGTSPVTATIFLAPGISRGGEGSAQLVLPAETRRARIKLALEEGDEYPVYRVELRDPEGAVVFARSLRPGRRGEVMLDIPAQVLSTGKYELSLKGGQGGGRFDDLSFYYLSVLRK